MGSNSLLYGLFWEGAGLGALGDPGMLAHFLPGPSHRLLASAQVPGMHGQLLPVCWGGAYTHGCRCDFREPCQDICLSVMVRLGWELLSQLQL